MKTCSVSCPHCGNRVDLNLKQSVEVEVAAYNPSAIPSHLSSEQKRLIEFAHQSGIVSALDQAFSEAASTTDRPKDLGYFFVTLIRTNTERAIPKVTLDILIRYYGGNRRIAMRSAQGIALVSADSRLVLVAPLSYIIGSNIRKNALGGGAKYRVDTDGSELVRWLREGKGNVRGVIQWNLARAAAISENGLADWYGPCGQCGKYFETVEHLEGHQCEGAQKAVKKQSALTFQGGLVNQG